MMKFLTPIFLVIFLSFGNTLTAQFNFKAGLNLGYLQAPTENDILNRYNTATPWLTEDMEQIGFLPGLEMGFRQRVRFVAFEATVRAKFQTIRGKGTDPATEALFEQKLSFSERTYSLGMDFLLGKAFIGGSLDYNRYRFRGEQTGVVEPVEIVREFSFGHHLHAGFEFEANETLHVRLQPYAQFFWNDINIFGLEQNFFPDTTAEPSNFDTRPVQFGIMLVLYNGYH